MTEGGETAFLVNSRNVETETVRKPSDAPSIPTLCCGSNFDYRFKFLGYGLEPEFVYQMNLGTGLLHMFNAVAVLIVWQTTVPDGTPADLEDTVGPYLPAICFNQSALGSGMPPFNVVPETAVTARTYLLVTILLFFMLSAGFQLSAGWSKSEYCDRLCKNSVNDRRYIEYSISASLMMVAIACSLFVFDMYTHILVFTCTMLCMMLGLVSDYLRVLARNMTKLLQQYPGGGPTDTRFHRPAPTNPAHGQQDEQSHVGGANDSSREVLELCILHTGQLKWFTHGLSWVAMLMPYMCFMVSYLRSTLRLWWVCGDYPDDVEPTPALVHAVVITQFLLFACFGVVQVLQFMPSQASDKVIGVYTEFRFIVLSIVSKTLLGWLVVASAMIL